MDANKQKTAQDMIKSIYQRYPDLRTSSHVLPIMHFNRMSVHKSIKDLDFAFSISEGTAKTSKVQLQKKTDDSVRLGCQTEDLVSRCLLRLSEAEESPNFVLFDYNLEGYLINLIPRKDRRKTPKAKSGSEDAKPNANDGNTTQNTDDKEISINKNSDQTCASGTTDGDTQDSSSAEQKQEREPVLPAPKTKKKKVVEEDFDYLFKDLEEKAKQIMPKSAFPSGFDFEDDHFRRAEYDALLISPEHGLTVVEVKTMKDRCSVATPQNETTQSKEKKENIQSTTEEASQSNEKKENTQSKTEEASQSEEVQENVQSECSNTEQSNQSKERLGNIQSQTKEASHSEAASKTEEPLHSQQPIATPPSSTDPEGTFRADLQKTVSKAIRQLQQAGLVLRYLTSDLQPHPPPLSKVLALPYVSRQRLRDVLLAAPLLCQALCHCLEVASIDQALKRCLCQEEASVALQNVEVTSPEEEPEVEDRLQTWWTEMTTELREEREKSPHCQMTWDIYEQVIARFCGPHSRTEGHSVADCIHLTGIHFGRSILRQEQLDILHSHHRFLFLTGPPGSGKTLLLGLKGVEWGRAGGMVVVICTAGVHMGSLVSRQLCQRIREALANTTTTTPTGDVPKDPHKTETSTPLIEDPETVTESDTKDASKPKKKGGRRRPKGKKPEKPAQTLAENVFLETMTTDTNITEFLENILQKPQASQRKVLFIVDEMVKVVTEQKQLNYMKTALEHIQKTLSAYSQLEQDLEKPHPLHDLRTLEDSSVQVEDSESHQKEKSRIRVKELLSSMKTKLRYLGNRLQMLTPRSGGPQVLQTDAWRELLGEGKRVREEVVKLRDRVEGVMESRLDLDVVSMEKVMTQAEDAMVKGMGDYYHAHTNLNFFARDTFFATVWRHPHPTELAVWVSSNHQNYTPEGYVSHRLTQCLRCPPVVQEILSLTADSVQNPPEIQYAQRGSDTEFPFPADGPEVKWISHGGHMDRCREINDCTDCGNALADYLLHDLRIGQSGGEEGLTVSDVLLSGSPIHNADCRFMQTLRHRGVGTAYENQELTSAPPYSDKAVIMGGATIQGLEAKIVVFVPEIQRITDKDDHLLGTAGRSSSSSSSSSNVKGQADPEADKLRRLGRWNREYLWMVASRCLSHLVILHV